MRRLRNGFLPIAASFALASAPFVFPAAAPAAAPANCSGGHYRDFDFWLGKWTVRGPKGRIAGHNVVTREQRGCVLQEHWTSARGGITGTSFNIFDSASGKWHQTWVDSSGTLLLLDGGLRGREMVLSGTLPDPAHGRALHRIVWTPLPDGRVRQHWQMSYDKGATWHEVFDGYYSRT